MVSRGGTHTSEAYPGRWNVARFDEASETNLLGLSHSPGVSIMGPVSTRASLKIHPSAIFPRQGGTSRVSLGRKVHRLADFYAPFAKFRDLNSWNTRNYVKQ